MDHFGFEKPELTAAQGMVPLACAVLSEDLERLGGATITERDATRAHKIHRNLCYTRHKVNGLSLIMFFFGGDFFI